LPKNIKKNTKRITEIDESTLNFRQNVHAFRYDINKWNFFLLYQSEFEKNYHKIEVKTRKINGVDLSLAKTQDELNAKINEIKVYLKAEETEKLSNYRFNIVKIQLIKSKYKSFYKDLDKIRETKQKDFEKVFGRKDLNIKFHTYIKSMAEKYKINLKTRSFVVLTNAINKLYNDYMEKFDKEKNDLTNQNFKMNIELSQFSSLHKICKFLPDNPQEYLRKQKLKEESDTFEVDPSIWEKTKKYIKNKFSFVHEERISFMIELNAMMDTYFLFSACDAAHGQISNTKWLLGIGANYAIRVFLEFIGVYAVWLLLQSSLDGAKSLISSYKCLTEKKDVDKKSFQCGKAVGYALHSVLMLLFADSARAIDSKK